MRRLFPQAATLSRLDTVRQFLQRTPCTLLYKGARSIIASPAAPFVAYNSSGGPYMANGGQGDVLSGVIAALAAQWGSAYSAARSAAYACGLAATHARATASNPPSTAASSVIRHLPTVLKG